MKARTLMQTDEPTDDLINCIESNQIDKAS
jgi:hypothetical protein